MHLYQLPDESQADTQATLCLLQRRVVLVKRLMDVRKVFGENAYTVIDNTDTNRLRSFIIGTA